MRVADVMTRDVESVAPHTPVQDVASRMKALDVGAIPVVEDGRPIGVVTDRDIVVRGAAVGEGIASLTAREVMTSDPVTLSADDWADDAAEVMQARQIRRVLVVNRDGRLCGIVSLGDLALRGRDDHLSEETLEDVSWPGHPSRTMLGSRSSTGRTAHHAIKAAEEATSVVAALLGGLALGAGLMYLMDPQAGRRRRTQMRDQAYAASRRARRHARRSAEHARDRAYGAFAEARHAVTPDHAPDVVINERIRAAIGRAVSHPGSIHVDVQGGVATLRGPVLAAEVESLLDAVRDTRGVRHVQDQLDVHETPGSIPGLQG